VVHASNRPDAIRKMIRAIEDYEITGIENTLAFGKFVMEHPAFIKGKFDTHFVQKYFSPDKLEQKLPEESMNVAAAFAGWLVQNQKPSTSLRLGAHQGKWKKNRK
jgi:acetyl-CoA carboxylase biotin carboxylase subunit